MQNNPIWFLQAQIHVLHAGPIVPLVVRARKTDKESSFEAMACSGLTALSFMVCIIFVRWE